VIVIVDPTTTVALVEPFTKMEVADDASDAAVLPTVKSPILFVIMHLLLGVSNS
jgi:hypothetical protein